MIDREYIYSMHYLCRICILIGQFCISQRLPKLVGKCQGVLAVANLRCMHENVLALIGQQPKTPTGTSPAKGPSPRRRVFMRQGDIIKLTLSREMLPAVQPRLPFRTLFATRISFNDDRNFGLHSRPRGLPL